jgi:DNA-directed RNA polymerase omega subunit
MRHSGKMNNLPIGDLEKMGLNRYEAVIVASRQARYLNIGRLKKLEQMELNPEIEIDSRKITMLALKDLLDGKVKFQRPDSM